MMTAILVILAFYAAPTALGIALLVRAQRVPRGNLCGTCGYDLRANPSQRCPECGASKQDTAKSSKRPRLPWQFYVGILLLIVPYLLAIAMIAIVAMNVDA